MWFVCLTSCPITLIIHVTTAMPFAMPLFLVRVLAKKVLISCEKLLFSVDYEEIAYDELIILNINGISIEMSILCKRTKNELLHTKCSFICIAIVPMCSECSIATSSQLLRQKYYHFSEICPKTDFCHFLEKQIGTVKKTCPYTSYLFACKYYVPYFIARSLTKLIATPLLFHTHNPHN